MKCPMYTNSTLTAGRLREALDYDPATGTFQWRQSNRRRRVGDIAGGLRSDGYRVIRIDGVGHRAHRLAWLYAYGVWPSADLDHRNRKHDDNRITNLREATQKQNQQNVRGPRMDNTSGFLGVFRQGERWYAKIRVDGQRRHLGNFNTPEEASAAYLTAKRELHPFWVGVAS